jgi:hypothetical protein
MIDMDDPNLAMPNTAMLLLQRPKPRRLYVLPRCMKSNTANEEPNLATPSTARELAHRAELRKAIELPKVTRSRMEQQP